MKFCALLILGYLAIANGAISQSRRGNNYQHNTFKAKTTATKSQYAQKYSSSVGSDDKVLRNDIEMKNDGSYNYQYETSNGITGAEHGMGGVSVQGSSSYISPEGIEIKTTYIADENGYHPVGDHIPKMPDYILRALEYIRTHPYNEEEDYKKSRSGNGGFIKKATPVHKVSTNIAPPTYKPTVRKVTPTTKRFNSFGVNNKFATNSKNQKRH